MNGNTQPLAPPSRHDWSTMTVDEIIADIAALVERARVAANVGVPFDDGHLRALMHPLARFR